MSGRFKGKVAVVTGVGRGVGRAAALILASEGAAVLANDNPKYHREVGEIQQSSDEVIAMITSTGGQGVTDHEDVSTPEGAEALVARAVDELGGLDIIINNAGLRIDSPFLDMTPDEFEGVVEANVTTSFMLIRFAAVQFRQQRSGNIVNITSEAGLGGGAANFGAASEAIVGLTRTVARDLGKYGVLCNAVSLPLSAVRGLDTGSQDSEFNTAGVLASLLCTDLMPNANGNVFAVQGNEISLFSNPMIRRSIHKEGQFTMDEMDRLVPRLMDWEEQ